MERFLYIAKSNRGRRIRGEIEAADQAAAVEALLGRQLLPLRVRAGGHSPAKALSYKDAARLSSELARLLSAGVPFETALRLMADAHNTQALQRILQTAAARLSEGSGAARAFAGIQGAPGHALTAIIASGERSGQLAGALEAAAPLFASTARFREKIVSLLTYPAVVGVTAIAVILVFLLVVIPSLRPVLEGLGEDIPTGARWLLDTASLAPAVFAGLLVLLLAIILSAQFPAIRASIQKARHRLALSPAGLGLSLSIDTALFATLFGALLRAETPAGDALEEAGGAVSNTILKARLLEAARRVREGRALEAALADALGEQNLVVRASRIGGRTSHFADLVAEAGATLADRAETRLERLASLAGPLIIIMLGLAIGIMTVTLFSSLSSLPDAALS